MVADFRLDESWPVLAVVVACEPWIEQASHSVLNDFVLRSWEEISGADSVCSSPPHPQVGH